MKQENGGASGWEMAANFSQIAQSESDAQRQDPPL